MAHPLTTRLQRRAGCGARRRGLLTATLTAALATALALPAAAASAPNGTWLSQPQIWFYSSKGLLPQVMAQIRAQRYRVVFLDYRKVSDAVQRQVASEARRQGLIPVVWIQSPQYRRMGIADLVHAARHGDGIQVDDHFFANYTLAAFYHLRQVYTKPIFCSIQLQHSTLSARCPAPQRLQSTRCAVLHSADLSGLRETGGSAWCRGEPLQPEHHRLPAQPGRAGLQHLPLERPHALRAACSNQQAVLPQRRRTRPPLRPSVHTVR